MRVLGRVFARRMRSSSFRQLPLRSQAIILIQPSESTGDQGSGRAPVSQYSTGSTCPPSRYAFTPAA